MENEIENRVNELVASGKPTIAFGFQRLNDGFDDKKISNIKQGLHYANIKLVGAENDIKSIKGFDNIATDKPEETLAKLLKNDEVKGIIPGTLDYIKVYEAYKKIANEKSTIVPALFHIHIPEKDYSFFLCCLGHEQCMNKESRLEAAILTAKFLKDVWNIDPKIAVLAAIRERHYYERKAVKTEIQQQLNKSFKEAEWIVDSLKTNGLNAKRYDVELNTAIKDGYNIIIPANGVVGNQIYKAFDVGGAPSMFNPRLGLSRCYAGSSKNDTSFDSYIRYLVAWINSKKP